MKQLQELLECVKTVVSQNKELKEMTSCLTQEIDLLSTKLVQLAQDNAELTEKIAALTQENAAILLKFDDLQTQAIQGLDALAEREQLAASLSHVLAGFENTQSSQECGN